MKIHNGIGDKLSLFVQFMATFFGGFAVGFIKEWRITLVLLGFTPLLAIILTFLTRVSLGIGLSTTRVILTQCFGRGSLLLKLYY